jgi:hypothetical protein
MKTTRLILALLVATLVLTACSENTANSDRNSRVTREEGFCLDEMRTSMTGKSVEDVIDWRLQAPNNIVLAVPVEITHNDNARDDGARSINSNGGYTVVYTFRIIDNLTPIDYLPEYITVLSQLGDIFEVGNEYLLSPDHRYNALWDIHVIFSWTQMIPRSSLSECDINRIRQTTTENEWSEILGVDIDGVVKNATLDSSFVSNVDVVMEITVLDKSPTFSPDVFHITYKVNDVLVGKGMATPPRGEPRTRRINTDVEVGGTYLLMLEVHEEGWTMLAARSGAVVSSTSREFAQYRNAFAALATE